MTIWCARKASLLEVEVKVPACTPESLVLFDIAQIHTPVRALVIAHQTRYVRVEIENLRNYLLKPFYELRDHLSEVSFSLFVVQQTLLVQSHLLIVPCDEGLVADDILIDEHLHEGWCILVEFSLVDSDKVENQRLQEVINTNLSFLFNQLDE